MFVGYIAPDGYTYDKLDYAPLIDKIAKGHLRILTPSLELVMEPGENLLIKDIDDTIEIDGVSGLGNIFITNKRVIYIREPPEYWKILEGSSPALFMAIPGMLSSKEAKEKKLKEFCQFRYIHIAKITDGFDDKSTILIFFERKNYLVRIKRSYADIVKGELEHRLIKHERKGFRKKYDVLWYANPNAIRDK